MPGDETRKMVESDLDSDSGSEDEEIIPKVEIDPSKLTPLSPEVISKQVRFKKPLGFSIGGLELSYFSGYNKHG